MKRAVDYFPGAWLDVAVAVGLFVYWLTVGLITDAVDASLSARKGISLGLALSCLGVSGYRIYGSFQLLGTPAEKSAPETIIGVFSEIVSLTETWGVCFAAARTWSLPEGHEFHSRTFLTYNADSVFEMGLVQAGVGWAAAAPITFSERAVAWCAAYIGGVLITNLYLLSIVVSRRGWWSLPQEPARPLDTAGAVGAWKFDSLGR